MKFSFLTRIFILIVPFCSIANRGLTQELDWATSIGSSSNEIGNSIAVDVSGNVYTTGYFGGTADFDPGAGVYNLTSSGAEDVFITKQDASGNLLWARSFGGTQDDRGSGVAFDALGNIYVTGVFRVTVDFDPGIGVYNMTSAGLTDIFIIKLDASGNFVWAKRMGATNGDGAANIELDDAGNIYATGNFSTTVDFDPGGGVYNLVTVGPANAFVLKLDASGNFVWAKSMSTNAHSSGIKLTIDAVGNVYTTGTFQGTVDFDPGAGTYNIVSENTTYPDIFVSKLDASGNFVWAKGFIGGSIDYGRGIEVDAAGNVYTAGSFQQEVDFDPGPGDYTMTVGGSSSDIFVCKLDALGNFVWAKQLGGMNSDGAQAMTMDASGNIYLTGWFNSATADFDPGIDTYTLFSAGGGDFFICKLDAMGDFVWAQSIGSISGDFGNDIAVDNIGSIYTTGYFSGTVDFDPGSVVTNLVSLGATDIFIQKMSGCNSATQTENITTCSAYTWKNGITYTTSQIGITHTVADAVSGGCDSTYTLNLTINNPTAGIDVIESCNSYTWIDGVTYTSSNNTATHVLTNSLGCDSVVTLNLTINNSTSGIDVIESCNSYTWIDGVTYTSSNNTATHVLTNSTGCDSVVTLNLTINNSTTGIDVIESCNSYTWIDGVTYTSSNNTATHVLTNSLGCDSVVTLNLTINNSTTGIDVIESCDSYTWIDGVTYTSSNNTATHVLTNSFGCDSVVTLNLTINNSTSGVDVIESCDSYTWIDGVTYSSSNNTATHILTNSQGCDSVVTLNLTINNSTSGIDVIESCDSYTWIDGVTYTSSNNTATYVLTNSLGCDSVVTLNLTINNATNGVDLIESCDVYTWIDGVTYTSSNNTATHVLTNSFGCDSVVTLNLTINNATTGIDVIESCDSYTWIDGLTYTLSNNTATYVLTNSLGCDSVVTLNLTINNATSGIDVIESCNSYTWIDGVTYTSSNNTATHVLTNSSGCDSVVTLNLIINNSTSGVDVIESCDSYTWIDGVTYTSSNNTATHVLTNSLGCDSVVTLNLAINNGPNMTASDNGSGTLLASTANSYQWIDCTTGNAIVGETSASFSPTTNGTYAVIGYSADLCADTSDCIVIDYLSVDEWSDFAWSIFPNPANDFVTIAFDFSQALLTIYDAQGRPVLQKMIEPGEQISLNQFDSGVYFFELNSAEGKTVKRVMKI